MILMQIAVCIERDPGTLTNGHLSRPSAISLALCPTRSIENEALRAVEATCGAVAEVAPGMGAVLFHILRLFKGGTLYGCGAGRN